MSRTALPWPNRRALALGLLAAIVAAPAPAWQGAAIAPKPARALSRAERGAAARVRTETIRDTTIRLASPEMEGRGTATPGGERAARLLAARFKALGLKPLGDDGGYLQAVKFEAEQALPTSFVRIGDATLKVGEDFVVAPPLSGDVDTRAPLAFAGYGVVAPELGRDDLAGIDVAGKIVVTLAGRPANVDPAAWERAAAPEAVVERLAARGAAGAIRVLLPSSSYSYEQVAGYLGRRRIRLPGGPSREAKLPFVLYAPNRTGERLFAGSGLTLAEAAASADRAEPASRDLAAKAIVSLRVERGEVIGSNVAGLIEGSDPALKSQAVIFSAHYDAYGRGPDGRVYPGAADNALGVGVLLSIAEAFARSRPRPRRSLVFLAFTGEEYGLLGAEHWVGNPNWPLERTAAVINFDGIGTEVYGPVERLVGFGAEYSDLGTVFEAVVAAMRKEVMPNPFPEEKPFLRSDHFAFVKRGIPALMMLGAPGGDVAEVGARAKRWLATDYHQPTDTIRPDWHWEGPTVLARAGLLVGRRVANAAELPAWLPDSPFNGPRGGARTGGGS
jgi:Zn-dependent M28 family amino/carboxypeptidase